MTQEEIKITQGLNPAQYEAVTNYDHPSLIVAGAGSGKTRVLTCRIAYMIAQGVAPYSIMALTFTNKAAKEMRERIETLVGPRSRYIWMGTFHAVFLKILSAEAEKIGYAPSFTIYDTAQSESLIKSILKELQLSDETYKPRDVRSRISLAKNNLVTPSAYEANASLMEDDRRRRMAQFYQIYKLYVARCRANNAMDFDDLLLNTNILFRDHPDVLEKYRQKFQYILVDEYQDTNYAQYLIVKKLSEGTSKVCVVGDDSQSIYSFRGAKIENIFRFQKDFPSAKVYKLEQNYRSTQTIVDAANSVIEHNAHRIKKRVFSENAVGDKIRVVKAYTDGEEAQLVASGMRAAHALQPDGGDWSQMAVLYRTNSQSRAIEEALRKREIPYRIYGGHSFYDRKEVKDIMAYFKTIANPRDDESLLRIINYPARGIGNVTIDRLKAVAAERRVSIWECLASATDQERSVLGKKVFEFHSLIEKLSLGRTEKTLYEFGLSVATQSGILGLYKLNPSPESESALQNIEELLNSMQNFRHEMIEVEGQEEVVEPSLEQWLQNVSLLTDMDGEEGERKNHVTLMTAHASKGLEFDHVFIVGMEENLFPNIIAITSPDQLEEERRLFYVALTRAKKCATISFAETRFKWGNVEFAKPSRFIGEIDPRYLDICYDEDEDDDNSSGRSQIEILKRRFDQRTGRTVVDKPSFQSRPTPTFKPQPQRPNIASMRSMGERKVVRDASEPEATNSSYTIGQRVSHPRFGRGTIVAVETLTTDTKITVDFEDAGAGRKSLLAKYAKLTVL